MRSNRALQKTRINENDNDNAVQVITPKGDTKDTEEEVEISKLLLGQQNLYELTKDAGNALTTFLFTCLLFFFPFINILFAIAIKFNANAGIKLNRLENRSDTFSRIMNSVGTFSIVTTSFYTLGIVIVIVLNPNFAIKFFQLLNCYR
jgi:hypothetical protein